MEGKGATARQSPSPEKTGRTSTEQQAQQEDRPDEADVPDMVNSLAPDDGMGENQEPGGEWVPQGDSENAPGGNQPAGSGGVQQPRVRVDARLLEATLLNLRKRIAAIPLVFDIPDAGAVSAERA